MKEAGLEVRLPFPPTNMSAMANYYTDHKKDHSIPARYLLRRGTFWQPQHTVWFGNLDTHPRHTFKHPVYHLMETHNTFGKSFYCI